MRKPQRILMLALFIFPLQAQEPTFSLPLDLEEGEELIQVQADISTYGALTVINRNDPAKKQYFVRFENVRTGPWLEVKYLQAAIDSSGFLYAAKNELGWFAVEGDKKYGPYYAISKLRSGNARNRCLYLAKENEKSNQILYNREKVIGGIPDLSDCVDYELSKNGAVCGKIETGLAADQILTINGQRYAEGSEINHLRISGSGKDIAYYLQASPLELIMNNVPKNESYTGRVHFSQSGSFGEFSMTDSLPYFKKPGDMALFRKGAILYYFYSYQDAGGQWRLFRNGIDLKVKERDIMLVHPLHEEHFAYSAKPAFENSDGLDTSKYYLYIDGQMVGGPFLEISEISNSLVNLSISAIARTAEGWFLIVVGGNIGPLEGIKDVVWFGESAITFYAIYNGEWHSLLYTADSGMQIGSLIIDKGAIRGIAHFNGEAIDIYLTD
jgi:hypothetical protein